MQDGGDQSYDVATTKSGKNAVTNLFKLRNSKILYNYCLGHALNLAVKDTYYIFLFETIFFELF